MKKRKANSKAQTTIFIILAILIVGAIAGTTYVVSENKKAASNEFFSRSDIKPTLDNIQQSILDCSTESSKQALQKIGVQGGYYKKPASETNTANIDDIFIPYYYDQGTINQPSKQEIETQLSLYVDENLGNCLSEINYENFKIIYKNPRSASLIKEKEVQFDIDLPVIIQREKYTTTLDLTNHPVNIPSELNYIIDLATFITETHKDDPELYCISCVAEIAAENDLYVDIVNFRENEMLVIISENHLSNEPYSFEFLNKYTGIEKSPLDPTTIAPDPPAELIEV